MASVDIAIPCYQYGRYLRTRNALVSINGVLFLHGGLSPAVAVQSCQAINDTVRRELTEDLAATREKPTEALTTREDGPLWYRGLARAPEATPAELDGILAAQKATAIVIGHTVTPTGRIDVRYDGRVFAIDTGMLSEYVKGGRASALEIQNGTFTAIYADKREVLVGAR